MLNNQVFLLYSQFLLFLELLDNGNSATNSSKFTVGYSRRTLLLVSVNFSDSLSNNSNSRSKFATINDFVDQKEPLIKNKTIKVVNYSAW